MSPDLKKCGFRNPKKTFFIFYIQNGEIIQKGTTNTSYGILVNRIKKMRASGGYFGVNLQIMEKKEY